MELTQKIRELTPYAPIQGEYAVRLDANESFIPLEGPVRKKALAAVAAVDFNRYPDPCCTALCRAFGDYYGIPSRLVTAGNGSDELISILMNCFFQKGDIVLTLAPDFSMYDFYGQLAELRVESLPKGEGPLDAGAVAAAVREKGAAGLIFSNPCNPTSLGAGRETIREVLKALPDTLVILDEAYMDFWDRSMLKEAEEYDNLVILRTCSKAMGLAGIRLGFAVAGEKLTGAFQAAKSPYNVNAMTQAVGEAVLRDREYLQSCVRRLKAAREELYRGLLALGERKPGAILALEEPVTNFVWVATRDDGMVFEGLKARSIVIRRMKDRLRITAGSPAENRALLEALEELL